MMDIPLVNLKRQHDKIRGEIQEAMNRVIDKNAFILGGEVENFEKKFAKFCNIKHCIGVSSGTDALMLIYDALGIKGGDEIITTPNTFFATIEPAIKLGAKPVFVDIDEKTFNIDPAKIEEKITDKTKAIVPVHLYGQPAQMEKILAIAEKYSLEVIEDACQAHGAEINGKTVPICKVAAFSFFPGKNLGAFGDAGAVVTNDDELAEKIRSLRNHGRKTKFESEIVGYNARIDALQAAILDVKLDKLKEWNQNRRENAKKYSELLNNQNIILPFEQENSKHVYHLYIIRVKERDKLLEKLKEKGIRAGIHYPDPLHLQKALKYLNLNEGLFPVTEKVSKEIISLPMFPEMTEEEIKYVCDSIKEFLK